jgi:hypothetical protein
VDGVFLAIYVLLSVRLAVALVGASPESGIARLIVLVTSPLYAVFSAILPDPTSDDRYVLALPVLLAILLYAVLQGISKKLVRKLARHRAYT